ncbi:MAG: DegT/DnrJ/EryC1/StrS family aminotransferase [Clostridia bacterium]|nr:DegT/DnrJ/EryC1/StrS family aminotransferase [Clostridia bacterium]
MREEPILVVRPSLPPLEEYIEELRPIWDSRWLTNAGPKSKQLAEQLKSHLKVDNVELFANGHLALELAISALGLKGEVITTPYTFASTTHAIVRSGLTPVFCDIKEDDYTIDVSKIESLITARTSAIIPVHVYGNVCDVAGIDAIARKHGLKVLYDAAHVFGVEVGGKGVGSFGDMSMFSFHATKVFNTVEGGAVTFGDPAYAAKFESLRQFGMDGQERVPLIGTNAKLTEVHAAMGICNLRHTDEQIAGRRRAVLRYRERLDGVRGIKLCKPAVGVKENYAYFPVVFDGYKLDRDEVLAKLNERGIYARKYFYPITSSFECYHGMFEIQETPVALRVSKRVLALPLYHDLAIEAVDEVCDTILGA